MRECNLTAHHRSAEADIAVGQLWFACCTVVWSGLLLGGIGPRAKQTRSHAGWVDTACLRTPPDAAGLHLLWRAYFLLWSFDSSVEWNLSGGSSGLDEGRQHTRRPLLLHSV